MKDLGVSVTSDLSWNSPINALVSKCNRMMGMIKRSVGYKTHINVTSYLYGTLVRSNLEHCSTVWSPLNFNGMQAPPPLFGENIAFSCIFLNKVKLIPLFSAKMWLTPPPLLHILDPPLLHYPDVKYSERCITLNLLPLSFRRDCADLIFFFKCLHGLYAVQLVDFLDTNLLDKSLRSTSVNCIFRPRL